MRRNASEAAWLAERPWRKFGKGRQALSTCSDLVKSKCRIAAVIRSTAGLSVAGAAGALMAAAPPAAAQVPVATVPAQAVETPGQTTATAEDREHPSANGVLVDRVEDGVVPTPPTGAADERSYLWSSGDVRMRVVERDYRQPAAFTIPQAGAFRPARGVNKHGAGTLGEISVERARLAWQFRGGLSRADYADGSHQSSPYFGVGLSRRF